MKNTNYKIVTIGMVPFSKSHLKHISINLGKKPKEFIELDSKKRLEIRGKDKMDKIIQRSKDAYDEYLGALKSEYIIVNAHGEEDKDSWEKRSWGSN